MDAEMREVVAEMVRAEVRAEMTVFAQHMRETATPNKYYDDWVRNGLDWYLDRAKGSDDVV